MLIASMKSEFCNPGYDIAQKYSSIYIHYKKFVHLNR